ncbi:MAG TPA: hypothetical protein VGE41_07845, partial [Verrucomicrobiae bacterium]
MISYPDTSFLCAFYIKQTNSVLAAQFAATLKEPLYLTELLRYEFVQSLRFQVWRRSNNPREGLALPDAEAALKQLDADFKSGVAELVSCNFIEILRLAETLSSSHTISDGHRSFDI